MKMMEVFVLKFKTVSKLHLPVLMQKHLPPPPSPASSGAASSQLSHLAPLTPGVVSSAPRLGGGLPQPKLVGVCAGQRDATRMLAMPPAAAS